MDKDIYNFLKIEPKQLECDTCKHTWLLDETQIKDQYVRNENLQTMFVHFFLCPKCQNIYIIAIIDNKVVRYIDKLKKKEKKINRMLKYGVSGGELDEEVSKREQLSKQLLAYEKSLKNKYEKHFYLRYEEVDH